MAAADTIVRFIIAVLFNGLWEAALLAIVAWVALRSMPNGNATTRHSVLVAALLASLILPIATAVVTTTQRTFAPVPAHAHVIRVPVKLPKIAAPAAQAQKMPVIAVPPRASIVLSRPLAIAIVVAWVLGALFVLVRLIVSLLHLEHLKKDALPVAVEYRAQLVRWSAATKGSRTVRLCRSSEIAIPIAVGLFDAMILIPEHFFDELEPADVDRIVLHELAHLRRADDWINAIERIASALLFFNPGIAWLVAQLDLEREVACDDWVLQQNDPLPYANCLAKVVETAVWPYRAMSAPGAFLTRRAMSVRIERLLTAHRDVRVRTSLGPTGIVIAALAALGIAAALVSPSFAYTVNPPLQTAARVVRHEIAVARHPIAVHHVAIAAAATAAPVASTQTRSFSVPTQVAANTPAYIDELAGAGYTNLTVDELVELRSLGVTGDYIRGLQSAGLQHPKVRELSQLRALGVQPDFVRAMRQHFGAVDVDQLCRLRALGVTPQYADQMMRAYPSLSVDDLAQLRAIGIDAAFLERANAHGFHNLTVEQLIRLKTSGIL